MNLDTMKVNFHTAYRIAERLAANPQVTVEQKREADELRQEAARNGWGQMVSAAAAQLAAANTEHLTSAFATGYWTAGNLSRRSYATTEDAMEAARELLADSDSRKWNDNGVLVQPKGSRTGRWVRG